MVSRFHFVVPCAKSASGSAAGAGDDLKVLLAHRNIIQWKADGKNLPRGIIPLWAGQWTLFGGEASLENAIEEAALAIFCEQTGVTLEKAGKEFPVESFQVKQFRDPDNYTLFMVVYAEMKEDTLDKLAAQVEKNIDDRVPESGLLLDTKVVSGKEALAMFHPTKPPKDGWQRFLMLNYYSGRSPGVLNLGQNFVLWYLLKRTVMSPAWFTHAVDFKLGSKARQKSTCKPATRSA